MGMTVSSRSILCCGICQRGLLNSGSVYSIRNLSEQIESDSKLLFVSAGILHSGKLRGRGILSSGSILGETIPNCKTGDDS
jgi:hypothetical protein